MKPFANPAHAAQFAELLRSSGYTPDGFRQTLGFSEILNPREEELPALLWNVRESTPFNFLVRLFVLGGSVAEGELEKQWTTPLVRAALEAGLLALDGGRVYARIRITPFEGVWLAHDRPTSQREPVPADFVMGIGASTATLAAMTVRRAVERALDLGCGCGPHALLAAAHSREVIASDINSRAVAFAQLNAQINGAANLSTCVGSLFEPVAGKFNLIISNPPFVISPRGKYIYRDSGLVGDAFVERVARQAADRLEEGGFCQMLCNWAHFTHAPAEQRLAEWFLESGCDVWVMESETRDVAAYAKAWLASTEDISAEEYPSEFSEWMRYYTQLGIERVSAGAIMMRKRTGRSFIHFERSPPRMAGPSGWDIARWFDARLLLSSVSDEQLFERAFTLSASVRLIEERRPANGRWEPVTAELFKSKGLAYRGPTDGFVATLLTRCDGRATLGELTISLARELGQAPSALAAHLAPLFRDLIGKGFLDHNPH